MHTSIPVHICRNAHMHTYTCTHAHIHTYMHIPYLHMYKEKYISIYTDIYTQSHTHMHIYSHVLTHTDTNTQMWLQILAMYAYRDINYTIKVKNKDEEID